MVSSSFDSATSPPHYTDSFSSLPSTGETLKALDSSLPGLGVSEEVEKQLRSLASYRSGNAYEEPDGPPLSSIPKTRLASVLVLLHLSPNGRELRVTLTTRSRRMRSHPGETALPGGKFEPLSDQTIEQTALREANEEISLPLPPTSPLLHLTNLAPYSSRTLLIVVPCVYFLQLPPNQATNWLQDRLVPSPEEVEAIFDCSLTKLLHLEPAQSRTTNNAADGNDSKHRYTYDYTDYSWPLSPTTPYRLHSFSSDSFASSITGLTADILVDTASIAHFGPEKGLGATLGFERTAEGQENWREICRRALRIEWKKGDPGRGVDIATASRKEVGLR